ncbi:MAG: S8 family serine peptidase [Candidatus Rokubacteria bacterium]|nr:S8 family serine peptidase [Candidatus Rokubacteria bacterium]
MSQRVRALVWAWLLVIAFASAAWAQPAGHEIYRGQHVAAGEVLVKFRPGATFTSMLHVAYLADAAVAHPVGTTGVQRMRSHSRDVAALINDLALHPDVLYVEPNFIVRTTAAPNDPMFGSLWGLQNTGQTINGAPGVAGADVKAVAAWTVTTGSRAAVVAVVDTGIDYTHPDLAANVWTAPSAFTVTINGTPITCPAGSHGFNAITSSCDPRDDNNHGTHVSGTIGAAGNNGTGVAGVNWTASIMGAKFLDASGSGSIANAINAIEFVIQAKAAFAAGGAANVRVLSNSWGGGGFSQAMLDEITKASANGMLFVAAAGNSSANNDVTAFYPADYAVANVVAVAATTNTDALASFSNYGPHTVHLGAPGQDVLSTIRSGSYAYFSGTSMATPHVSGAAALILSQCGSLDTASLKGAILGNVDPIAPLAGKTVTGGRLNVSRAVNACASPGPADFTLALSPATNTVAQGGRATYTVTVGAVNGFGGAVTLSASGLPSGATASFVPPSVTGAGTATLTVATTASTPVGASTITVTGVSGSLSHSAGVTLTVLAPSADLTITKTASAAAVSLGSSVTYTIIAGNNGPTGATNVKVMDSLPAGLSFVSATPSQGSCSGTTTVTCSLGALAKAATAKVTLVAKTTATGSIRNTASVQATEPDPSAGNNSASATISVSKSHKANVSVKTQTSGPYAVAGNVFGYLITVRNAGPDPATGVMMTDVFSPNALVLLVLATQGTCGASLPLTCVAGSVPNGATAQYMVFVLPIARGTMTSSVSVSATEPDPEPGNNMASVAIRIR